MSFYLARAHASSVTSYSSDFILMFFFFFVSFPVIAPTVITDFSVRLCVHFPLVLTLCKFLSPASVGASCSRDLSLPF